MASNGPGHDNSSPPFPEGELVTPGHPSSYEEQLWQQAFGASDIRDGLHARLEELGSEIEAYSSRFVETERRNETEAEYWRVHQRLQEVADYENALLEVLERVQNGEASDEELLQLLPAQSKDEQTELSQRKLALKRERERLGIDPREIAGEMFMLGLTVGADPGRLTSGRSRTRLVSANGLTPNRAAEAFFESTVDTHGGKVRKHGKHPGYYTGRGGKRFRKY